MLKGEPNSTHILLSDLSEWMESLAVGFVHIAMIVYKGVEEWLNGPLDSFSLAAGLCTISYKH